MKNKINKNKKGEDLLVLLDDVLHKSDNKYHVIVKIAGEIKEIFDLSGERNDTLVTKKLNEIKGKRQNEKDSSGSDR